MISKLQFEEFANLVKVLLRAAKVVLASLTASLAVGRVFPSFRACFLFKDPMLFFGLFWLP